MKKVIYSMLALLCAAFAFTSCEDVPMPYDQPGEGGEDPVIVEPVGDGTLENPYNVAAALEYVNNLAADEKSESNIYIKGKVSSINTNYDESGTYGNAIFYISDDGTGKDAFYVYRALYLGNKKYSSGETLNEGDDVIICGKVVNYKGTTPETVQSEAFLYSLNGNTAGGGGGQSGTAKGSGTQADPYNPVAAINYANQVGDKESDNEVYIKGKVSKITTNYVADNFGNATFYISEDGTENDEFYCYRTLYLGNKKYTSGDLLKVGDEVVVCGKVTSYKGNTPETVANKSYLYSLNGKTEGGGGGGDTPGGEVKKVSIADFNAAAESTDVWYQLTGTVKNLKDGDKYGNFDLEDETGSVYVYGLLSEKGGEKQKFQELAAAKGIQNGSVITIIGNRGSYNGKIEVMNAYFVSIGDGGGSGGGETGDYQGNQAGEVSGNVITVQVSAFGLDNQTKLSTLKLTDGTTLKFDGGGNSNTPAYYTAGDGTIRMYPKNSMTVNAGNKTISEIVITCENYNGTIYNASGNININGATKAVNNDVLTYTSVNSSNVTVSNDASGSGSATQLRFKTLKITYAQ